jgi:hypothetical protein
MSDICVVHLVWGPLGTSTLEKFAASYRERPAGLPHRLTVLLNGVGGDTQRAALLAALSDIPHDVIATPRPMLDLAAYITAARALDHEHLCFLNSYSEPLDAGWLEKLWRHMSRERVGLVGATGSYESFSTHAPFVTKPLRRRQFPLFPNPHVRTNAFMMARETMLALAWKPVRTKTAAWKLESGRNNITRQVWQRGLEALVVGRDGEAYARDRFFESNTFRRADQPNLLVADNRTREWDEADPARRRWLAELAWGKDAARRQP